MTRPHKRRRFSSAVSVSDKKDAASALQASHPSRGMWLDLFPPDVRERIAAHVCRDVQNRHALRLAQTSPALRHAVLGVLKYCFTMYIGNSHTMQFMCNAKNDADAWDTVFAEDVVGVIYEKEFINDWGVGPPRFPIPLMSAPKLRVVHIRDHPEHVAALARSSSIREVVISIDGSVPANVLFESMLRLRVERLKTICVGEKLRGCPFADRNSFGPDVNALAGCCPHLVSLEVLCNGSDYFCDVKDHAIWRALPALITLREIGIYGPLVSYMPQEAVEFVSALDSVKLRGRFVTRVVAAQIGAAVTEVDGQMWDRFSSEDIMALARCRRLRTLSCHMRTGTEPALLETVRVLPELTSLSLCWTDSCEWGIRIEEVAPGILLRTVQAARRNLRVLCLYGVRIPLNELEEILKSLGRRLHKFATWVGGQHESPLERLCGLLQAAAKYNPELRSLHVSDSGGRRRDKDSGSDAQALRREQGRLAESLLQRLEQNTPFLSHDLRIMILVMVRG